MKRQTNIEGGPLSHVKSAHYDLTVLGHDAATMKRIITALTEQYGNRPGNRERPQCTKRFIKKVEDKNMIESVEAYLKSANAYREQPTRVSETSSNVQEHHGPEGRH